VVFLIACELCSTRPSAAAMLIDTDHDEESRRCTVSQSDQFPLIGESIKYFGRLAYLEAAKPCDHGYRLFDAE
jgi:hypothetical protein